MRRGGLSVAPRLLLAAAALLLIACSSPAAPGTVDAAPASIDPDRALLLGGIPPGEAERGVYVVDVAAAGDQNPGSRLAPIIGPLIGEAEMFVETAAPPITLLGGLPADAKVPPAAVRVGDVVVLAEPGVRDAVVSRLEDGAAPDASLAEIAGATTPVAWTGPAPTTGQGTGTTLVTLSQDEVTLTFTPDVGVQPAAEQAKRELAEGAPPGSPGKPWRSIIGDAEVTTAGDRVTITGTPLDLPGLFLRALIDQRQLAFLAG